MRQVSGFRRVGRCAALVGLIAVVSAVAAPAGASAAPCTAEIGSTSWLGGSGSFQVDGNWSGGGPSAACDTFITAPGTYTVSMTAGASMKSFTFGNASGTQTLDISGESPNTNLNATTGPSSIGPNAAIVLTCPGGGCSGGGGPNLNFGASNATNAGSITVAAASGGSAISGNIANTGTLQINGPTTHNNATLLNQGMIGIADGITFTSSGSSCGDTGVAVKNDSGGQISAAGNGTLSVINYEQGNGTTSGTLPVQIPCGSLKYTGNGASKVQANGGFALTGTMAASQALTVSAAANNTIATLGGDFTNNGSITLTCPGGGCNGGAGGGAGFNGNGKAFTNAGTFTVAAASGTGAGLGSGSGGVITNTGTMQFDQSAGLGGVVVNKGPINIADGITATSSGSSCGDTGGSVKNDVGGQINATGTGTLSVLNYEQGAGTTSGSAPVQMPCGSLKYTGSGAGTVQVNGGLSMTGNIAAGQTLRIVGGVNAPAFTNAGTIVFDQSTTGPSLNSSGTLTNTGRLVVTGPSVHVANFGGGGAIDQTGAAAEVVVAAGTNFNVGNTLQLKAGKLTGAGIILGSVDNQGGVVAPGSSAGTLRVNGNYSQGAAGRLEIEVAGIAAGQFDQLVVFGNATLGGALALQPGAGYVDASAIGQSFDFLTYGGTLTAQFAQTTVSPELVCPKQLTVAYANAAKEKKVSAVVSSTGATCGGGGGGGGNSGGGNSGGGSGGGGGGGGSSVTPAPIAAAIPDTKIGTHPKAKITTKKTKVKVNFTFSSDIAGAKFKCKLDKGAYASCASPKAYKVSPGKHKFSVVAIGPGGEDKTPASFGFKVVRQQG